MNNGQKKLIIQKLINKIIFQQITRKILKQFIIKINMIIQKKQKIKPFNKLVQLDDKYKLQAKQKQKVTLVLEDEVQFLLDKKQRQKQKRKRIKQLEAQYERKRKQKIEMYEQKIQQSAQLKQTVLKDKLSKNKRNLDHIDKIHNKFTQDHIQNISKGYDKRKQFYSADITPRNHKKTDNQNRINKSREDNIKSQEDNIKNLNLSRNSQNDHTGRSVDKQMNLIQQKLSKTKNNRLLLGKQLSDRFHQKSKHYSSVKQKIKSTSMIEQQKNLRQMFGKDQQIVQAHRNIKDLTEKHLKDRQKIFQSKIQKLQQNIKHIEQEKKQKYQQLQQKFVRIYAMSPTVRTTTNHTHRQRVILNNLKLDEEKKHKASQILKKHAQITVKNKIYKQKKDQILQTIKKVNPQDD